MRFHMRQVPVPVPRMISPKYCFYAPTIRVSGARRANLNIWRYATLLFIHTMEPTVIYISQGYFFTKHFNTDANPSGSVLV